MRHLAQISFKIVLLTSVIGLVITVLGYGVFKVIRFIPEQVSCLNSTQRQTLRQTTPLQSQILAAAKERTTHSVTYRSAYYSSNGGKPPDNEGVCTDLFWRSLAGANIDFPTLITADMKQDPSSYPLHIWDTTTPDPVIDYRRVPNIEVYLEKYAQKLSPNMIPCDMENLQTWQPGDIVLFRLKPKGIPDHIAIVSDTRDPLGIPYLIHNYGVGEVEQPGEPWFPFAIGHYRWREE